MERRLPSLIAVSYTHLEESEKESDTKLEHSSDKKEGIIKKKHTNKFIAFGQLMPVSYTHLPIPVFISNRPFPNGYCDSLITPALLASFIKVRIFLM